MEEMGSIIDTEEIAEFFYRELINRGYVPDEQEVLELADITFDYLIKKNIINEEWEED